jgi:hypothetical protein
MAVTKEEPTDRRLPASVGWGPLPADGQTDTSNSHLSPEAAEARVLSAICKGAIGRSLTSC